MTNYQHEHDSRPPAGTPGDATPLAGTSTPDRPSSPQGGPHGPQQSPLDVESIIRRIESLAVPGWCNVLAGYVPGSTAAVCEDCGGPAPVAFTLASEAGRPLHERCVKHALAYLNLWLVQDDFADVEVRRVHAPREFRVTFGQRYPREPHPTFGKAHHDGWLSVFANTEQAAREIAFNWLGNRWAFIYDPDDDGYPTRDVFPLGELHRIGDTP